MEELVDSSIEKNIWKSIDLYKKTSKNNKCTIASRIINEIKTLDKKCMCNMIKRFDSCLVSEEITFAFLAKCKKTCNFCQIKHINNLQFNYIKKLKTCDYLKIFKFEDLLNNTEILNILVNSNCLSLQQLCNILSVNNNVSFDDAFVKKIIKMFSDSNFDTTKPVYNILSLMLKTDNIIDKHSKLFSTLIIVLAQNDKLDIFDEKSISLFTNNDNILNYAIKKSSEKQLEKIITKCTNISISSNNFYTIYYKFESDLTKQIVSKMTNIFSYISYCSNKMNNRTVDIIVESANIIKSLPQLNNEEVYEDLCTQVNIFINYTGEVGYDASGLRKDFFTNCSLEWMKLMEECDGYLTISKNLDLSAIEIKFISLMIARSIFLENISPQIKFHPLLSYLMITGGYFINFEHFYKFMSHFEIEFIQNTFKLLKLSDSDYEMFIDLQDNEKLKNMTKSQYIMNKITKKYVHPKLIEFVNGFRVFFKSLYFTDYVNPIIFHKYICGNESYEIFGNTQHSLKFNLKISGVISKQREMFEKTFLNILNELNSTSIVKLQLFFKYWFATSSIISFSDRDPIVYINSCSTYNEYNKYHCFYSATCFDKLTITISHKDFTNEKSLELFLINAINSSIENQKIWESTGVHMQLA